MTPPLLVRQTDDLRLAGALLAAGPWPDQEQARHPYKPHRVAELARRCLAPHEGHPAAQAAAALAADEIGLERLYAAAAAGAWPQGLAQHLLDFASAAQLTELWVTTQAAWDQAQADLSDVLAGVPLTGFLASLFGPLPVSLEVYPNLLYPGRQALVFDSGQGLTVALPPPLAWGASPPWRYRERPDEVLAVLATALVQALYRRCLPAEHRALGPHAGTFALAAAVLFLRQALGPAAGDQFLVMEKKARGLPQLPYVVAALEAAVEAGPRRLDEYVADVASALGRS